MIRVRGRGRTVEGDAREDEADNHARGGDDHDLAAADDVYVLQREEREDKVRAGDNQADGNGVVETDLLKESSYGEVSGYLS